MRNQEPERQSGPQTADDLALEYLKGLKKTVLNLELLWMRLKSLEEHVDRIELRQNSLSARFAQAKSSKTGIFAEEQRSNTPITIADVEENIKRLQLSDQKSSLPQQAQPTMIAPS